MTLVCAMMRVNNRCWQVSFMTAWRVVLGITARKHSQRSVSAAGPAPPRPNPARTKAQVAQPALRNSLEKGKGAKWGPTKANG